jgi:hypothetical protein
MNREGYWLLANALATQPNTPLKYETVLELCKVLKAANPKFDSERFLDASESAPRVVGPRRGVMKRPIVISPNMNSAKCPECGKVIKGKGDSKMVQAALNHECPCHEITLLNMFDPISYERAGDPKLGPRRG